jgi:hypothetical protein
MSRARGRAVASNALGGIALFWLVIGTWAGIVLWSAAARGLNGLRHPGASGTALGRHGHGSPAQGIGRYHPWAGSLLFDSKTSSS